MGIGDWGYYNSKSTIIFLLFNITGTSKSETKSAGPNCPLTPKYFVNTISINSSRVPDSPFISYNNCAVSPPHPTRLEYLPVNEFPILFHSLQRTDEQSLFFL